MRRQAAGWMTRCWGVAPIEITDPHDRLVGRLAPNAHAMHWRGEQFTLPEDAVKLAQSDHTEVQAFRLGSRAWGMLFHLEIDDDLLDIWLAKPSMAAQAERSLGGNYREQLRGALPALDPRRAHAVFGE